MTCAPDIDPYAVLGVPKDATLTEIKAAHRKLVLKCHPDKIKDESQRSQAQDEFQKVQQAYELLSDDTRRTRYDQKARLAELRRQMMEREGSGSHSPYSSPRGSGSSAPREYRDGRIYEERAPADAAFFDDEMRYTEEPRSTSRKYEDMGKRTRSRGTDEKKKTKSVPLSTDRVAKETARESVKASHSDRAKNRTKERRREAHAKFERVAPSVDSYGESSESDASIYVRVRRPSESRRSHDESSRKAKPESTRRSEPRRYEDDDYSDELDKHEHLHTSARDYIMRSKGNAPIEIDRRNRSSRSPQRYHGYESAEPELSSSRRSGRTPRESRSSKETIRPSSSRHGSYEHLEPQPRTYEAKIPSMPTAATSPGIKVSSSARPPLQPSRSATTAYVRKREGSSRADPTLLNMVYGEPITSRSSKLRGMDRHDSGYSSPSTPEMHPSGSPPKSSSTRYKVVGERETIRVDPDIPPSSSRHQRSYSPVRQERPSISVRSASKPTRSSTTYTYTPDPSARYETTRPSPSRQPPLFGEVENTTRLRDKDVKFGREIGPDDIAYSHIRDPYTRHHYEDHRYTTTRRQSALA